VIATARGNKETDEDQSESNGSQWDENKERTVYDASMNCWGQTNHHYFLCLALAALILPYSTGILPRKKNQQKGKNKDKTVSAHEINFDIIQFMTA